jgi:excisionase family DNA binding protein
VDTQASYEVVRLVADEIASALARRILPELKLLLEITAPGAGSAPPPRSVADVAGLRLSTAEAASLARVKRKTVAGWIRGGRLVAVRPPGTRKYLIAKADLEAFLAAEAHLERGRSLDAEARVHRALGI